MKKMKIFLFLIIASLLAVAAVACDGNGGTNNESITRKELIDEAKYGLVEVAADSNVGSGFVAGILDGGCTMITNHHIIDGATSAQVRFFDESDYRVVQVIGYSKEYDIAVLFVEYVPQKIHVFEFEDNPQVGQDILSLGYNGALSAYDGMVSNAAKFVKIHDLNVSLYVTETTALAPQGSSGGPCISMDGGLVGVSAYNVTVGGVMTALSYKIPASIVQAVYTTVMQSDKRPFVIALPFVFHSDGSVVVTCFEGQFKVVPRFGQLVVEDSKTDKFVNGTTICAANGKEADVLTLISQLILTRKNTEITFFGCGTES